MFYLGQNVPILNHRIDFDRKWYTKRAKFDNFWPENGPQMTQIGPQEAPLTKIYQIYSTR